MRRGRSGFRVTEDSALGCRFAPRKARAPLIGDASGETGHPPLAQYSSVPPGHEKNGKPMKSPGIPPGQLSHKLTSGELNNILRVLIMFQDLAGEELALFLEQMKTFVEDSEGKTLSEIFGINNDYSIFLDE